MGNANIPTDWTGNYIDYVVRWPNSEQWEAILRGQLTNPAFIDFWDLFSGDPNSSIGAIHQTFDENLHLQEGAVLNAGLILDYAGPAIPDGWLVCDGSEVSRVEYARLFAAIGTIYGAGDGTTTFELPAARGRVNVALDPTDADFNSLGEFRGVKSVILEESEIPAHTHVQNAHTHVQNAHTHTQTAHDHTLPAHNHTQTAHDHILDGGINAATGAVARGMIAVGSGSNNTTSRTSTPTIQNASPNIATETAVNQNATAVNQNATAVNQNTGSGAAHDNLQPSIVFYRLIKA